MAKKDMKQSNKVSVNNCKNNNVRNSSNSNSSNSNSSSMNSSNSNSNVTDSNSNKVSNKAKNGIGFDDEEAHSFKLDEDNGDSFKLK